MVCPCRTSAPQQVAETHHEQRQAPRPTQQVHSFRRAQAQRDPELVNLDVMSTETTEQHGHPWMYSGVVGAKAQHAHWTTLATTGA